MTFDKYLLADKEIKFKNKSIMRNHIICLKFMTSSNTEGQGSSSKKENKLIQLKIVLKLDETDLLEIESRRQVI